MDKKLIGICVHCGREICIDDDYCTDANGNLYCDDQCYLNAHNLKEDSYWDEYEWH